MAEVRLTVVANQIEAEVLCGLLRTNGIECAYRRTDVAAGMADAGPGIGGPQEVFVDERQLEEARQLLPSG